MSDDFPQDNATLQSSDRQNRSLVMASWILMGLVCLVSLVPFLGFASWLVAGPILFVCLVMGIVVLSRGGTVPGLVILLTSMIVAPVFVFVAPFISSLLGVGATAAGVAAVAPVAAAPTYSYPVSTRRSAPDEAPPMTTTPAPATAPPTVPVSEPEPKKSAPSAPIPAYTGPNAREYETLRSQLQGQSDQLSTLKRLGMANEGVNGYLQSDDRLNLTQRQLVQQENVWREKMFTLIAARTSKSRDEVATAFARMARTGSAPAAAAAAPR